jgi:hypothetical protein
LGDVEAERQAIKALDRQYGYDHRHPVQLKPRGGGHSLAATGGSVDTYLLVIGPKAAQLIENLELPLTRQFSISLCGEAAREVAYAFCLLHRFLWDSGAVSGDVSPENQTWTDVATAGWESIWNDHDMQDVFDDLDVRRELDKYGRRDWFVKLFAAGRGHYDQAKCGRLNAARGDADPATDSDSENED